MTIALIALNARGLSLAKRLCPELDAARTHGLAGRADAADIVFDDTIGHLRNLYRDGVTIVGLCAVGILVRALSSELQDKRKDAPVIALAEDGSVVIPVIGGHHGANALAQRIASLTGGIAAITTAGDLRFGFSLDDPPDGWHIANPELAKPVMAALLSDAGARLDGHAAWLANAPWNGSATYRVSISERAAIPDENTLVIHPKSLVVGVGCERGCDPDELQHLVAATLFEAGLAPEAIAALASLDLKMNEHAVHETASAFDVPVRFFDAATLENEMPRLRNPSDVVFQATGCHGVAEGAALAMAGPESELIVAKNKSRRATCAVARAMQPVDPRSQGIPRGELHIVGIGPGDESWRSPEASAAVSAAEVIVGYHLYLDLLGDIAPHAVRRGYGLGQEEERVRDALVTASGGRRVALVCSGDAGIYALASLVFESIDTATDPGWRRVAVTVAPGISAMQAAAARAGAPLGHDFCAISLSDLLTPSDVILRRLKAAASGDFVTALYNPKSKKRRDLLVQAREILSAARPPSTPVVVARNLGRADEVVSVTTLAALDLDMVDMLTILIIGNRDTRLVSGDGAPRVYTPRGYRAKR